LVELLILISQQTEKVVEETIDLVFILLVEHRKSVSTNKSCSMQFNILSALHSIHCNTCIQKIGTGCCFAVAIGQKCEILADKS
jgi:hypothetical protein